MNNEKIKEVVNCVQHSKNSKAAIVTHQDPVKGAKEDKEQDGIFTFDLYALDENDLLGLCDLVGIERPK